MYGVHPAIENIHALRDSLGVIVRARIPIGRDGSNRPSLFPFGTATGRNAQAKSLYNAHASMRSFMEFPEDTIAIYADFRTQEIGVAAARSGDEQLIADYIAGDIYHALALMCGLTNDTNISRWKKDNKAQRNRMKALQLGISYGMGVRSLAKGLDRHPLIASEVIIRHKRRYPRFWEWRANMVEQAMLTRKMESEFDGWPLHLSTSPNKRTLFNFPMQSGGGEMLRLAAVQLCEADLVPNMLVHDGILVEVRSEEQVEQVMEIMRHAGTTTCNGLEIGVDIDQRLERGARYRDKRPLAGKMWATMMDVLQEIGALPKTGTCNGTGLKFKNGKFVRRTEEEARRLETYFAAAEKPKRVAKKNEPFIRVTMKQLDKLIPIMHRAPEVSIFFMLCHESFRHRGAAFESAIRQVATDRQLQPEDTTARHRLSGEKGLISVERRHRKPPTVQILTVTSDRQRLF